jgi:hypothetical protein
VVDKSKQIWTEWSFVAGVLVTVGVLAIFWWSLTLPVVDDGDHFASKWEYLQQATPNEVGDTLAGVAGSLAFVWVVVAVLLQATELREQRREFEKMSEAQIAQAAVLEKQAEIFSIEQIQRRQTDAKDELDQLLLGLSTRLTIESETADLTQVHLLSPNALGEKPRRLHFFAGKSEESVDQHIFRNSERISDFWLRHDGEFAVGAQVFLEEISLYREIEVLLEKIESLEPDLSLAQKQRLKNLNFAMLKQDLAELVRNWPSGVENTTKQEGCGR